MPDLVTTGEEGTSRGRGPTLRQMVIAVLTQRGDPMSYRELTDTIWAAYPEFYRHMIELYENERKARTEQRIRMGILVRDTPGVFTATKADVLDDADEDEAVDESVAAPSVYWYTFPAYRNTNGPYPIKVGRGNNPMARIGQQVTAMPEQPDILG